MSRSDPIAEFVTRAARRAGWILAAQSLAVALSATAIVVAAAELDGADALRADVLAVAALCGALAGSMWWGEQHASRREVARRADERLAQSGALLTAFEAARTPSAPFAALLSRRAAGALPSDALARAEPPPSLAWLAAPLFAAGLWLLASQATPPSHLGLVELATRVEGALDGAAGVGVQSARDAARELRDRAGDARTPDAELASAAARLDRELARLLGPGVLDPGRRLQLDGERARLRSEEKSLRTASAPAGAGAGDRGGPNARSAAVPTLQNAVGESTMQGWASDGTDLDHAAGAPPRGDSTASDAQTRPDQPAVAEHGLAEPGVVAGRWWSAEQDAVVAAWRRRAR